MLARRTPLARTGPLKRAPMKRKAKAKARVMPDRGPWRSEEYLAFVRSHPCCVCGKPGPSEAHHFGGKGSHGTGQKCSDAFVSPVDRMCHNDWHTLGTFRDPDDDWEQMTRVEAELIQVIAQRNLLAEWVAR